MKKIYTKQFLTLELEKLERQHVGNLANGDFHKLNLMKTALDHYQQIEKICEQLKLTPPETRWGTPAWYVNLVRKVFPHQINLDPASQAEFNQTVRADRFYTKEDDGLKQFWNAVYVYCNPPYGKELYLFIDKALVEVGLKHCKNVILLGSRRGSKLYRQRKIAWLQAGGIICEHHKRIAFQTPEGVLESGPRHDSDTFYLGDNPEAFRKVFGAHGDIIDSRWLHMAVYDI